ncbi:MAG TPA: DUF2905 domain-containing protein [Kosmotogaceae bacterium]|nr:DUF2905 domain-containing protein [Kosmotogaceae bacterium]
MIRFGVALVIVGVVFLLLKRTGLVLGRLPGDIVIEREGFHFWFPVVSCLVVSGVITAVFWVISLLRKLL